MKSKKTWKKTLPMAVVGCALVAGSSSYSKPAYSCSFWSPLSCITGGGGSPAIKDWAYDTGAGVGNWFKDLGKSVGQFAVRDVWGKLITAFSCPFSTFDAFGTRLACFSSSAMETGRVLSALNFISTDERNDFTYVTMNGDTPSSHTFAPRSFSLSRIAYILNGYANEALLFTGDRHDANADATSTVLQTGMSAPVIVWPSAYQRYPNNVGLAGVLVHEADHTRFGHHTCSSAADTNEDGPYGTEIQYLAKMWRTGHPKYTLATLDRDMAWDIAVAKIGQLCNPEAQRRVWNTYLIDAPTANRNALAAATSWHQAVGPAVTDISVVANGSVYGLGGDGAVYRSNDFYQTWARITEPNVTRISVTPAENIYGIGTDNAVYRTAGARYEPVWSDGVLVGISYEPGIWTQVATPWVQEISVPTDDYIYGIGSDNAVYRAAPGGDWAQVAPPWVKSLSVTPDGTIYGVGSDNAVFRTTANSGSWARVATPSVSTISVTPDGFIYGVGDDNAVFVTRSDASWQVATAPWVSKISVTADGIIYGIGSDQAVYERSSLR